MEQKTQQAIAKVLLMVLKQKKFQDFYEQEFHEYITETRETEKQMISQLEELIGTIGTSESSGEEKQGQGQQLNPKQQQQLQSRRKQNEDENEDEDREPGGQGRVKDPEHDGRLKENRDDRR